MAGKEGPALAVKAAGNASSPHDHGVVAAASFKGESAARTT